MQDDWANERLEVIRTLMERAAIYRRALAPIMGMIGLLGLLAAFLGWFFKLNAPIQFGLFWMTVSCLALGGALFLTRRQALHDKEPFWSSPARRVTQALLPALFAGAMVGIFHTTSPDNQLQLACSLPPVWMLLYGCAVHAAGFFMPRGIKLLGWLFLVAGGGLMFCLALTERVYPLGYAHLLMGLFFGGFHLAYAVYLFFTEKRDAVA